MSNKKTVYMNCKRVEKILPQYIQETLSEEESMKLKSHLDSCTQCTNLYNKLLKTLALLKPKAEIQEQAFYYTSLKQKMENRYKQHEPIINKLLVRKILQPTMYLTSLIIAVYIGILIGSTSPNQNQFSDLNSESTDYIKIFAEYQYLNDLEIEAIENNLIISEDTINE